MEMKNKIQGIIVPLVTPLLDCDTLDTKGLKRLIEHVIISNINGIFILGTTGEGPSLSYSLRYEIVECCCEIVNGRVPVMVGITDTSIVESVNLAKAASDSGASAVVMASPYYFPAGQIELIEYIQHLLDKIDLPLFLYNMPSCTKLNFGSKII